MNQETFGKKINAAKSSISCYETGKRTPPIELIEAISDTFNLDVNYILGNDSYEIAENKSNYGMNMSKEELDFIKEIRTYKRVHNMVIKNPRKSAYLINKKI